VAGDTLHFYDSLCSTVAMIVMGRNQSTLRKTCPNANVFTTNPTWMGLGLNPGFRGKRLVTNHPLIYHQRFMIISVNMA
jgi:hypothetical protein